MSATSENMGLTERAPPRPAGRAVRRVIGSPYSAASLTFGLIFLPLSFIPFGLKIYSDAVVGALSFLVCLGIFAINLGRMKGIRAKGGAGVAEPIERALIILFCCGLASCAVATFLFRGMMAFSMWGQFFMTSALALLFPVYCTLVADRSMLRPIMLGLSLLALIMIGSVYLHVAGIVRGEQYGSRQFGYFGDSVAWMISAFIPVFFERRKWVFLVLAVVALAFTGSRTPALVAGAAIVASTALRPVLTPAQAAMRMVSIGVVALLMLLAPIFMATAVQRIAETDLLYNDRLTTVLFGLQRFLISPIIGMGFNDQAFIYVLRFGDRNGVGMILNTQVSSAVQVLTDFGLVGFLPYAVAMGLIVKSCFSVIRSKASDGLTGRNLDFFRTVRGLACWLVPFIFLNHSATYLAAISYLGLLFFVASGIVVGLDRHITLSARQAGKSRAAAPKGVRRRGPAGQARLPVR